MPISVMVAVSPQTNFEISFVNNLPVSSCLSIYVLHYVLLVYATFVPITYAFKVNVHSC